MICWILLIRSNLLAVAGDQYDNALDIYDDRHPNDIVPGDTSCIRLALSFKKALLEEIKNKLTASLVYNCDLEFTAAYAGEKRRDFVDFCTDCAVLRFPFKAPQHGGTTVQAIVRAAMNRWGSRWDYHADCGHPVGCAEFYWDLMKVNGVFTCVFNKTGFLDRWGQCPLDSSAPGKTIEQENEIQAI